MRRPTRKGLLKTIRDSPPGRLLKKVGVSISQSTPIKKLRQSAAVKNTVEFIKRDVSSVNYHANVDVHLTNGVSDHFVVDVVDPTSSRKLVPVMLFASNRGRRGAAPPGRDLDSARAKLVLLSGLAALYFGLRGDSAMRDTLKHMTYKELALIPIGEFDVSGATGFAALTADLTAGARASDQAPTVAEMSRLKQWVQTNEAGKPASV